MDYSVLNGFTLVQGFSSLFLHCFCAQRFISFWFNHLGQLGVEFLSDCNLY